MLPELERVRVIMTQQMIRGRRSWLVSLGLLALGCQSQSATPPAADKAVAPAAAPAPVTKEPLVIFAAASLRDAFGNLRDEFVKTNPTVEITFNFAGTQELRTQLEHGAPVDVFASADKKNMDALEQGSKVSKAAVFARNEPVIVVAKEKQGKVSGLADLPKLDRLVVGTPEVPIGRYTVQILGNAGKTLGVDFAASFDKKVASRELDVRQVLNKVVLGEADAGIVYRTDANSAKDKVGVVTIPAELNVIAEYPIAVTSAAAHPTPAGAWVKFVLSPAGQEVLNAAGFLSPTVVAGL
jgi:molybdate transport system substrate-binding protein